MHQYRLQTGLGVERSERVGVRQPAREPHASDVGRRPVAAVAVQQRPPVEDRPVHGARLRPRFLASVSPDRQLEERAAGRLEGLHDRPSGRDRRRERVGEQPGASWTERGPGSIRVERGGGYRDESCARQWRESPHTLRAGEAGEQRDADQRGDSESTGNAQRRELGYPGTEQRGRARGWDRLQREEDAARRPEDGVRPGGRWRRGRTPAAERAHGAADEDQYEGGNRYGGRHVVAQEVRGTRHGRAGRAPERLAGEVGILGADGEVPGIHRHEDERGQCRGGEQAGARGPRRATNEPHGGEEAERHEDGRGHVEEVHERLEHDECHDRERVGEALGRPGGEQHDEREVVEDGVVERGGRGPPEEPSAHEQRPRRDEAGRVRSCPPPDDHVDGPGGQRDPGEKRDVQRERRVAAEPEHRCEKGQRPGRRGAVEECVPRRMEDVPLDDPRGRGRQRVRLPGQRPPGVQRVELGGPPRVRQMRPEVRRERPAEHDGESRIERQRGGGLHGAVPSASTIRPRARLPTRARAEQRCADDVSRPEPPVIILRGDHGETRSTRRSGGHRRAGDEAVADVLRVPRDDGDAASTHVSKIGGHRAAGKEIGLLYSTGACRAAAGVPRGRASGARPRRTPRRHPRRAPASRR